MIMRPPGWQTLTSSLTNLGLVGMCSPLSRLQTRSNDPSSNGWSKASATWKLHWSPKPSVLAISSPLAAYTGIKPLKRVFYSYLFTDLKKKKVTGLHIAESDILDIRLLKSSPASQTICNGNKKSALLLQHFEKSVPPASKGNDRERVSGSKEFIYLNRTQGNTFCFCLVLSSYVSATSSHTAADIYHLHAFGWAFKPELITIKIKIFGFA